MAGLEIQASCRRVYEVAQPIQGAIQAGSARIGVSHRWKQGFRVFGSTPEL
jgi:hypothetical protein